MSMTTVTYSQLAANASFGGYEGHFTMTPPHPSETVAEALREIRSAVQDGNLSQGVRLDIIDKIALRALKGEE